MRRAASRIAGAVTIALISASAPVVAADYPQPLPEEPVPAVAVLPEKYPANWVFVHDLHFNSLPDGRVAVVDVAAENRNVKGQIPAAQYAMCCPPRPGRKSMSGRRFSRG